MKIFPLFCEATRTCRYHTERWSQRVKQFVSYCLMYCQKKTTVIVLLCMYGYPYIWTEKPPRFAKWISIHQLVCFFFLNEKLLVAKWWSVVALTHLAVQSVAVHSHVQRLLNAFSERCFLSLISRWYCTGWWWLALPLPLRSLSIFSSFTLVNSSFCSFHNLFIDVVSACSIAPVNTNLANLPDSWFAFCFAYSIFNRLQRSGLIYRFWKFDLRGPTMARMNR